MRISIQCNIHNYICINNIGSAHITRLHLGTYESVVEGAEVSKHSPSQIVLLLFRKGHFSTFRVSKDAVFLASSCCQTF